MDDTEKTAIEAASAPETSATPSVPEVADSTPKADAGKSGGINRSIWMGTAVGIGSAAIVAALLYTKRKK